MEGEGNKNTITNQEKGKATRESKMKRRKTFKESSVPAFFYVVPITQFSMF